MPFDPGTHDTSSVAYNALNDCDRDIVIDTGAGRSIKHGLVNPRPVASRIVWGDGSTADSCVQATMPGHNLPPFLITPKVNDTLVSVGSNTEGTTDCYAFFDKHSFVLSGLQIFKNEKNELDARFIGPHAGRVKYIATKSHAGGVYKAPSFDVFKPNETSAWRFPSSVSQFIQCHSWSCDTSLVRCRCIKGG